VVRQEILDRLLELKHERYAAEVKSDLHPKRGRKRATDPRSLPNQSISGDSAFPDSRDFTARAAVVACRRNCLYAEDISV
jgi:hypothetical protein